MKKFIKPSKSKESRLSEVGPQVESDLSDSAEKNTTRLPPRPNLSLSRSNAGIADVVTASLARAERENAQLKDAVHRLSLENLDLRDRTMVHNEATADSPNGPPSPRRWRQVQSLVQRLLDENHHFAQTLAANRDLEQQLKRAYGDENDRLLAQIDAMEQQKLTTPNDSVLAFEYELLCRRVAAMQQQDVHKLTVQEHEQRVTQLDKLVTELKQKHAQHILELQWQLDNVLSQHKLLASKLAQTAAECDILKKQNDALKDALRTTDTAMVHARNEMQQMHVEKSALENTLQEVLAVAQETSDAQEQLVQDKRQLELYAEEQDSIIEELTKSNDTLKQRLKRIQGLTKK